MLRAPALTAPPGRAGRWMLEGGGEYAACSADLLAEYVRFKTQRLESMHSGFFFAIRPPRDREGSITRCGNLD